MRTVIPFLAVFFAVTSAWSQGAINNAGTMQNQGDNVYQNSVPSNGMNQAGNAMTNGTLLATNLVTRGTNDFGPGENTNRWNGTNNWQATNGYPPNRLGNSSTNGVPQKHWWQKIF